MVGEAERIFAEGIEGVGRSARRLSLDGLPAGAFLLLVNRLHARTVEAPAVTSTSRRFDDRGWKPPALRRPQSGGAEADSLSFLEMPYGYERKI